MKHIIIYTPGSTKAYYNAFYHLQEQGRLKVNLINSRFFYQLLIKINNHSKAFRLIRKITTKKSNKIRNEPEIKQIIQSFLAPITLLFKKNLILGFNPYDNIIYYLILLKFLKKNIIFDTSWAYWNTKRYVKKPFLISKFLWKVFLRNTKTVSCNKATLKSLKIYKIKPYYLPHGIDTEIFRPKDQKQKNKNQQNTNNQTKILYIGRLIQEKGIKDILKISEEFKNCKFIFVGEGPLQKLIKQKLIKYKNIKYIPFINNKRKLAEIYASSDIFILNSYATQKWEEWFGIALIEAMSCGLPCISTDCIGPKEIITNNKNGILIPQKNQQVLKQAISKLLKNKQSRIKLGKQARKTAVQNYDIKKLAKQAEMII